jgi:enediyne biosynthesis protein E4
VSNRDGIGAAVRMKARIGGQTYWQMRPIASQSSGLSLMAHFGLADAVMAETVRLEWPSGMVQELGNVAANRILTVAESPRLE